MTGARPSEAAPTARGLQFRLLGPVEAVRDGALVDLGPRKQRAVLALLLLNANRVVPTERLIDDLWGEAAPETARSALQVYVAGLRKALGNDGVALRTRAPGYVLELEPGVLDLERFVRQRAEARAADDDEQRATLLHDALALWRDAPLAELSSEPFSTAAVAQLEQLRLGALEERIDADLALGRHAALLPELDALVAEHPYRERLRAQLMLALYRSGRQAEALEAYQAGRRVLSEQLGLEPSKELRELEGAILRQDESLAVGGRVIPLRLPGAEPAPLAPPSVPPRRTLPLRRRWVAVLAAILVAVVVAATALLRGGTEPVAVLPNSVAVIDAESGRVGLAVPVGIRPGPLAVGAGSVWVGNLDDRTLTRIDLASRRVVKTIALPATPTAVAFGAGAVWVAHGQTGRLSRVDPQFETVTTTDLTGSSLYFSRAGVAVGAGSVWIAFGDTTLASASPADGRETGSALAGAGPAAAAFDSGAVWVANTGDATVVRFDPSSFETGPVQQPITVGRRPTGLVVRDGSVWVASAGDDSVTRIDIGTRSSATIPVGDGPTAVAAGVDAIWVANTAAGSVSQIDPATNEVQPEIDVGGAIAGVAVADGSVWVSVQEP